MHRSNRDSQPMGPRIRTRCASPPLGVLLVLCLLLTPPVNATTIVPGVPKKDGTVTYTVELKNGTTKTVTVDVTKGLPKNEKADAIQQALNAAGIRDASVTASGNVDVAETKRITAIDTTGEKDRFVAMGLVPAFGEVGFLGTLTGIDFDGVEAKYEAAFGFQGLLADSSIFYGDLSTQTIDGLLTATFNNLSADLPTSLQSKLKLDLAADTILFEFPSSAEDPFVEALSLDAHLSSSQSLTVVPEPGSLTLFGGGYLGTVLVAWWRKRGAQG